MTSNPAPDSFVRSSLAPWISVPNIAKALDFYKSAFGAKEVYRLEEGGVARLSVDGAEFWLAEGPSEDPGEGPTEPGVPSPQPVGGGSVRMILTVADPDAVFARSIAAGASEIFPVGEDHGWRLGRLADPFGLHW